MCLQTDILSEMIEPRIADTDLCQFFLDHLEKDLKVLQKALGRTGDDICLLLHHVCTTMAQQQQGDVHILLHLICRYINYGECFIYTLTKLGSKI